MESSNLKEEKMLRSKNAKTGKTVAATQPSSGDVRVDVQWITRSREGPGLIMQYKVFRFGHQDN